MCLLVLRFLIVPYMVTTLIQSAVDPGPGSLLLMEFGLNKQLHYTRHTYTYIFNVQSTVMRLE